MNNSADSAISQPDETPSRPWLIAAPLAAAAVFHPAIVSAYYLPKLAWLSAAAGVGFLFLALARRRAEATLRLSPLLLAYSAYALWALCSAAWAPAPWVVADRWIQIFLMGALALLASKSRFWRSEAFWNVALGFLCILALVGIAQSAPAASRQGSWAWWIGGWIPSRGYPSITMGYRNQAAMFLALALPFAVWRGFASRRKASAALALLCAALAVAFIVIARTRSAWLGLCAAGLWVFFAGIGRRSARFAPRAFALPALMMLLLLSVPLTPGLGAGGLLAKSVPRLKRNLTQALMSIPQGGDAGRLDMWRFAARHIAPLGVGLGCFPIDAVALEDNVLQLNWEVHNDYLQNLVDLGLPGLLLFLALGAAAMRAAWLGRYRGETLAAGATFTALLTMLFFTFLARRLDSLIWVALAGGVLHRASRRDAWALAIRLSAAPQRLLSGVLGIALLIWAILAAVAMQADARLSDLLRTAPPDRRQLDQVTFPAATRALRSMRADTTVGHIHAHEFALLAARARLPEHIDRFARMGLQRHPGDRGLYELRARAAMLRGVLTEAIALQEKAVALAEPSPPARSLERLSAYYARAGLSQRAADAADRARRQGAPKFDRTD